MELELVTHYTNLWTNTFLRSKLIKKKDNNSEKQQIYFIQ